MTTVPWGEAGTPTRSDSRSSHSPAVDPKVSLPPAGGPAAGGAASTQQQDVDPAPITQLPSGKRTSVKMKLMQGTGRSPRRPRRSWPTGPRCPANIPESPEPGMGWAGARFQKDPESSDFPKRLPGEGRDSTNSRCPRQGARLRPTCPRC